MTAELVAGQNLAWPGARVTAYVEHPRADISAMLLGPSYRVRSNDDLVFYNAPAYDGVGWFAGPPQAIVVDLAQVPTSVERVLCVASLDSGTFAGEPPRVLLADADGQPVATFVPSPTGNETAVVACEIYRRGEEWKVRAVGQGFTGGLGQAVTEHGIEVDQPTSPSSHQSGHQAAANLTQQPSQPAAGDATPPSSPPAGPAESEDLGRLLEIGAMILDDASRSTASLLSTIDFAQRQLEGDLEQIVGDPSMRVGPAGDQARAGAQAKYDEMVRQAKERHASDLNQLSTELKDYERKLPAPLTRWGSGPWQRWSPGEMVLAFRLGDLSLPDSPAFRLPLMQYLPMRRPVWVETADGGDQAASQIMHTIAVRILAAMAPAKPLVSVIDIGGRRGTLGLPNELLAHPPVTDTAGATRALAEVVEHIDLVTMAVQAGNHDALEEKYRHDRLVLIADHPTGLDESAARSLHRILTDGPPTGVQTVVTGSHSEALGVPILELLHQLFLRIPSAPGGDLVDGYGGVDWTFVPDLGPNPAQLDVIQNALVAARQPQGMNPYGAG